ncbi:MAG: prephenate dehydrogenase [Anaerolineales bacterium]|nr:prephenate dehydrogenase [Anaerolineales bacterium]
MQIALIGLGQIGTSFGLALSTHHKLISCVGCDVDAQVAQLALQKQAVSRIYATPQEAVQTADVVLLSLPMDRLKTVMQQVAPEMPAGATLIDTAPLKEVVGNWARELLPEGRAYVGLTPVINPKYLHGTRTGIQAARQDLFRNAVMAISAPPWGDPKALKLAADLARLLEAIPVVVDPVDVDTMMSATHIAPQLLAAALLNATVNHASWRDASMLAGRAYAEVSGPVTHLGAPDALATTALLNAEGVLRVLDSVLASLETLRNDIATGQVEELSRRLQRAYRERQRWWHERQQVEEKTADLPESKPNQAAGKFSALLRTVHRPQMEDQQSG